MAEDEVVENGEGGDKPKRRVKKSSPKPRGRSPGPEGSPTNAKKTTTKKKEKQPSADLPCNPSREKSASPSKKPKGGAARSQSPKKDSSHHNEGKNGENNHHNHNKSSPKKKRADASPRPPRRNATEESLISKKSDRGRSPEKQSKRRLQSSGNSDKDITNTSNSHRSKAGGGNNSSSSHNNHKQEGIGNTSSRHKSPTRAGSPKRGGASGGKGSPTAKNGNNTHSKHNKSNKPKGSPTKKKTGKGSERKLDVHNSGQFSAGQQSMDLDDLANDDDEHDDAADDTETESEYSGGSPRYISPKGNTTHLQLDLSTIGGGSGEMPVFSLLDENSLLDGCTDDEGEGQPKSSQQKRNPARNPSLKNPHRDSLLDTVNSRKLQVQRRLSSTNEPPPQPLQFKAWGFNDRDGDDDNDRDVTKSPTRNSGGNLSPRGAARSPRALGKAFKALKYTTNMSGATNLMEKMTNNLSTRLGFSPQHQQMKDDDDLDSLLS